MKTIVIQGAMEEELGVLKGFLTPQKEVCEAGYRFFLAKHRGCDIIISETQSGIINATMSTALAIMRFQPDLIINQGCAGAHKIGLNVGEIIVGETAAYINDFKQPAQPEGAGSDSLLWTPNRSRSYRVAATPELVKIATQIQFDHAVIAGCLGSGDVFSKEFDRIKFLERTFGSFCEDMESVATYKTCDNFGIAKIGFRVVSNNELTGAPFDKAIAAVAQNFTIKFVDELLPALACE